jgi:hypothetical protein
MKKTIYSRALDKAIETGRIIGAIQGTQPGPMLVFFGGIHGNEPSGLFALHHVYHELRESECAFHGEFVAMSGNLWALSQQKRYDKYDLNRLWTPAGIRKLQHHAFSEEEMSEDIYQQQEIFQGVNGLLDASKGPYYFFDLHTTSSDTEPFITINDTLLNRQFSRLYPVPIILGIEEFLEGPLLSYINELGYISIGFEAGQNDHLISVANHRAFIYLSLFNSGFIDRVPFDDYDTHYSMLRQSSSSRQEVFEIKLRYQIQENEAFTMQPGYRNFQPITKNEHLADNEKGPIRSPMTGRVFMPLYQTQGDDGYFILRHISGWVLRLSAVLRRWQSHKFLVWLPGVTWHDKPRHVLKVNTRTARFLTKQVFHILGYRVWEQTQRTVIMRQREYHTKIVDYRTAPWNTQTRR